MALALGMTWEGAVPGGRGSLIRVQGDCKVATWTTTRPLWARDSLRRSGRGGLFCQVALQLGLGLHPHCVQGENQKAARRRRRGLPVRPGLQSVSGAREGGGGAGPTRAPDPPARVTAPPPPPATPERC